VRKLFSNPDTRSTILSLTNFTFGITHHHTDDGKKDSFLELNIEQGITDPEVLKQIYTAFFYVLENLELTVNPNRISPA